MTYSLTAPQLAMLRFVQGYLLAHDGIAPTVRECARVCGGSKSTAHGLLVGLERRGAIRRLRRRERAIEVLTAVAVPTIDGAPLYAVSGPWTQQERGHAA